MKTSAPNVVIIGDVNVDVICLLKDQLHPDSDSTSVNRLSIGGSSCNAASWSHQAGINYEFHSAIGRDQFGELVLNHFDKLGMDSTYIDVHETERTGSCVVLVDQHGGRTMFPDPGANLALKMHKDLRDSICRSEFVVMSCYSFFRPESRTIAVEVAELCRENSIRLILDAASSAPIKEVGAELVIQYLKNAWLVIANSDENIALNEGSAESDWRTEFANVVIKSGAHGASWYTHGVLRVFSPAVAIPATQVIDSTGAGDAFMAGLLSVLSSAGSLQTANDPADLTSEVVSDAVIERSLMEGNRLGAMCISQVGAQPQGKIH